MAALGRPLAQPRAVPRLHLCTRHAHAVEQQLQMVLRMGDGIVAGKGLVSFRRTGGTEFVPHIRAHRQVEVGQDDRAIGQFADLPQQRRQRGGGAGDAGRDEGRCGRIGPEPFRCGAEQQIAPRGRVAFTTRLQFGQPFQLDPRE